MKRDLVNSWYPYLRGQRGEACLELGLDPVPKKNIIQCFTEDWQEADHISECLPYEEEGIAIRPLGNLIGGYYF